MNFIESKHILRIVYFWFFNYKYMLFVISDYLCLYDILRVQQYLIIYEISFLNIYLISISIIINNH
jgi:hypothetical protein